MAMNKNIRNSCAVQKKNRLQTEQLGTRYAGQLFIKIPLRGMVFFGSTLRSHVPKVHCSREGFVFQANFFLLLCAHDGLVTMIMQGSFFLCYFL